jgi:hypothetical protein
VPSLFLPSKQKTLADTDIVLPQPGGTQIVILVLGFSHKGGEKCAPWGKRLSSDFQSEAYVTYYQLPVLQGAPSFVRPMILRGMRKDLPAEQQAHFIPILDHEDEWKKLVSFSAPDDAYILVTDPHGRVAWQTHGPLTDSSYGPKIRPLQTPHPSLPVAFAVPAPGMRKKLAQRVSKRWDRSTRKRQCAGGAALSRTTSSSLGCDRPYFRSCRLYRQRLESVDIPATVGRPIWCTAAQFLRR